MSWWDAVARWFASETGQAVAFGALIPFVAIVVAGLVAALIARGAIRRLLRAHDRELKTATIGALMDAARQASVWDSSSPAERTLADRAAAESDLRLRLLPLSGAASAADWSAYRIRELKRASATFSLQVDAPLADFRDRLVEWHAHARRARKGFDADLARWRAEEEAEQKRLRDEQAAWAAQQDAAATDSRPDHRAEPATSPAASAPSTPAAALGAVEPPTIEPYSPVATRRSADERERRAESESLTANGR